MAYTAVPPYTPTLTGGTTYGTTYGSTPSYPYNVNQTYTSQNLGTSQLGTTQMGEGVEADRRRVQTVILNEEVLGEAPEEQVTYVEIPVVQEIIRHVPKKEFVEIEKKVPKYEYEFVERVVEIPQVQYVDKQIEVPQVHEVLRHVPRREVVEVPKEIIKQVPKIETKIVEKVVEVPGERIEIPKPYVVEQKVPTMHYIDNEVPMVVAQTLKPIITETNDHVDIDVVEYEPEVIPVNIHVPKTLPTQLIAKGVVDEVHRVVNVPAAQYNSMLRLLNPHISDKDAQALPYMTTNGAVSFLGNSEVVTQATPVPGVEIIGWNPQQSDFQNPHGHGGHAHSQTMNRHMVDYSQGGMIHRAVSDSHTSRVSKSRSKLSVTESSIRSGAPHKQSHKHGSRLQRPKTARKAKGGCPC